MSLNTHIHKQIESYLAEATPAFPEMALDKHHPNNAEFYRQQNTFKRLIVMQSMKMKDSHVQIAKLLIKGNTNVKIAADLKLHLQTISNVKARDDVKEMVSLLHHLAILNEGPSIEHRKRILYEITVDSQELEPKTSIAAIQEMNRMDGVGREKIDTAINITINNDTLPRGALDA
mgnify:CR=1 FL=1